MSQVGELPISITTSQDGLLVRRLDIHDTLEFFHLICDNEQYLADAEESIIDNFPTPEKLAVFLAAYADTKYYGMYAITHSETLIGSVTVTVADEVEVGYWVDQNNTRRGVATSAVSAVTGHQTKQTRAVTANARRDNIGSRRVLEKSGFKLIEARSTPDEVTYRTEPKRLWLS